MSSCTALANFKPLIFSFSAVASALMGCGLVHADQYDDKMAIAHDRMEHADYAGAEAASSAAVEAAKKDFQERQRWKLADALKLLGGAQAYGGKAKEGLLTLELALKEAEKTTGENSELVGLILNDLGVVTFELNDYDKTEKYLNRTLEVMEANKTTTQPEYASTLHNLAGLADKQKNYRRAEKYYLRAIQAYRDGGVKDEHLALSLMLFGQMLAVTNRKDEALPLAQEALEIFKTELGPDNPQTQRAQQFLGSLKS